MIIITIIIITIIITIIIIIIMVIINSDTFIICTPTKVFE